MGDISRDELLEKFEHFRVWRQGDDQAPNKPLLLLYALGRWWKERATLLPFADIERDLTELLKQFGPDRVSIHPEYPFWRLQNDGIWVVYLPAGVQLELSSSGDARKRELLDFNVQAGFSQPVLGIFETEPGIVQQIATLILGGHFPPSDHQRILARVGLG